MGIICRLLCLSAALTVTVPALAFELVHDADIVKLQHTPKTIASFDLAVADSLTALGIDVAGVPELNWAGALEKFNQPNKTEIGTLFEPDYDALKKLSPELIFAGGRSGKAIPELNKIAPTATYAINTNAFLEDFRKSNLALANAFGKTEQAQGMLKAIDANIKALHAVNNGKKGAFLFVMNDFVMAHAPGDRFGYAYDLTGLTSVVPPKSPEERAQPRPKPGSEAAKAAAIRRAQVIADIAKADPDWLIVLDRGAINGGKKKAAETLAKHPELSNTSAFKQGRVYYADPDGWYLIGAGLGNLTTMTAEMLAVMSK